MIGSGPAGQRAAVQAAKLQKSVLVVEEKKIGGACAHTGTIPSKTLREAALADRLHDAQTLKRVMEKVVKVIELETRVLSDQLERNKVQFVEGIGSLVSQTAVRIQGPEKNVIINAHFIVLAVGTSPSHVDDIQYNKFNIFDSDSVLQMTELPSQLAVIGAGVIGCEYASIFARLGCHVTLIDKRKDLLKAVDQEIVEALKNHFTESGIEFALGVQIGKIQVAQDSYGKQAVKIRIDGNDRYFTHALICWGRQGNVERLGLEAVGLQPEERGIIAVNDFYQTSVPNIYAVGDVIGPPALAASSGEQGRLAACHAFGVVHEKFPDSFPYGIYTIPEISSAGMQESDLLVKNIPFVVGRARYRELARGQILGEHHGLLKLLVHRETHRLLGVHIIGYGATELVHIGQVAYALGANIEFMVRNVFNYPTLAEAYKVAAYNAKNQL